MRSAYLLRGDPRRRLIALSLASLSTALIACGGSGDGGDDRSPTTTEGAGAAETPIIEPGPNPADIEEYEQLVEFVVSDVDDYWRRTFPEVFENKDPYESPEVLGEYTSEEDAPYCGEDQLGLANAYYCAADDFIAWDGPGLLFPFYQAGDMGAAYVIAHEWGHAIQARAGAILDIISILAELQADCFAGAWAADADSRGIVEPGDLEEAILALYTVRDPAGTPWLDPSAHGSAARRIGAFTDGFNKGPEACLTYVPF